jgi:hypothetical protein
MDNWQDLHLKQEIPISQKIHKLFLLCIVRQNQYLNKENTQHSLFRHIIPNTQMFSEYVQYNETVKTRSWWWTCAPTTYLNITWSSHSTLLQRDWELHLRHTLDENYWNTIDFLTSNSLSLSSHKQFSYLQVWTVGCFLFPCRSHVPATSVRDERQMLQVSNNFWVYTRKCCIKAKKNFTSYYYYYFEPLYCMLFVWVSPPPPL